MKSIVITPDYQPEVVYCLLARLLDLRQNLFLSFQSISEINTRRSNHVQQFNLFLVKFRALLLAK
jgi:hypothetical protein